MSHPNVALRQIALLIYVTRLLEAQLQAAGIDLPDCPAIDPEPLADIMMVRTARAEADGLIPSKEIAWIQERQHGLHRKT